MKENKHNGFTVTICFGRYAGFYFSTKQSIRICLGWVALSVYPYDRETKINDGIKQLQNQINKAHGNFEFKVDETTKGIDPCVTWHVQGSNFWFELEDTSFVDYDFKSGDIVTASYDFLVLPDDYEKQCFKFKVSSIQGHKMYVDTAFGVSPEIANNNFVHIDSRKFPTKNYVSGIKLEKVVETTKN